MKEGLRRAPVSSARVPAVGGVVSDRTGAEGHSSLALPEGARKQAGPFGQAER
jgi:hypothetical protein